MLLGFTAQAAVVILFVMPPRQNLQVIAHNTALIPDADQWQ